MFHFDLQLCLRILKTDIKTTTLNNIRQHQTKWRKLESIFLQSLSIVATIVSAAIYYHKAIVTKEYYLSLLRIA